MTMITQEDPPMTTIMSNCSTPAMTPGQLILGEVSWGHIRASEAHHREFPEIRAEGGSPAAAVQNLANCLARVLDTAITRHDREQIENALDDIHSARGVY
jgi:hypothetical protein